MTVRPWLCASCFSRCISTAGQKTRGVRVLTAMSVVGKKEHACTYAASCRHRGPWWARPETALAGCKSAECQRSRALIRRRTRLAKHNGAPWVRLWAIHTGREKGEGKNWGKPQTRLCGMAWSQKDTHAAPRFISLPMRLSAMSARRSSSMTRATRAARCPAGSWSSMLAAKLRVSFTVSVAYMLSCCNT